MHLHARTRSSQGLAGAASHVARPQQRPRDVLDKVDCTRVVDGGRVVRVLVLQPVNRRVAAEARGNRRHELLDALPQLAHVLVTERAQRATQDDAVWDDVVSIAALAGWREVVRYASRTAAW